MVTSTTVVVEVVVWASVDVVVEYCGREPSFLIVLKPSLSRASKPSSVAPFTASSVASATSSGEASFGAIATNSYSALTRVLAGFACRRRRPVDAAATDPNAVT